MKASIKQQQQQVYKTDEHSMFTVQRSFVAAIISVGCYTDWLNCLFIVVALACCFPFFHDGMYYVTRQKLDGIYKKGWFDQSATSTAKSDKLHLFGPTSRTLFAIASAGLIIYEIIKFW